MATNKMNAGRPPVCIDIDNTIADTDRVLRGLIHEVTDGRVKLNRSDVTQYEYWKCVDSGGQRLAKEEWNRVLSLFNSERLLEVAPLDGVVACLERIRAKFEVQLVTSRDPSTEPLTLSWLGDRHIPYDGLHFARHREKHTVQLPFAFAVDDDPGQATAFSRIGIPAIVLSQPWNQLVQGSDIERLPDWAAISSRMLRPHRTDRA